MAEISFPDTFFQDVWTCKISDTLAFRVTEQRNEMESQAITQNSMISLNIIPQLKNTSERVHIHENMPNFSHFGSEWILVNKAKISLIKTS